AFVYNIRSAQASRQPHGRSAHQPTRRASKEAQLTGSPEAQLRAAIAQIGLVRARQILDEVEDTFTGR
ncbi:MAG TPA: hypothetical protein VER04_08375, partial [Polyangiaceae bacterium]|nr:hypothetical protein [Polyangiaceae bacterium]